MKGLQGKVAIVTGGSSGIGQAIAIRLGEEGVNVAINYVGAMEGAEETREAIEHGVQMCLKACSESGTHPILVKADVSKEDEVAQMFADVLRDYGRIDWWWPSRYGPDDEAGALNEITATKVVEAVRLVRQGRVYDLAHVLHEAI